MKSREIELLMYHVSTGLDVQQTAREFGFDWLHLAQWLKDPEVKRQLRRIKRGYKNRNTQRVQQLEDLAFSTIEHNMRKAKKASDRNQAAKIAIEEARHRRRENELHELAETYQMHIDADTTEFMNVPTLQEDEDE